MIFCFAKIFWHLFSTIYKLMCRKNSAFTIVIYLMFILVTLVLWPMTLSVHRWIQKNILLSFLSPLPWIQNAQRIIFSLRKMKNIFYQIYHYIIWDYVRLCIETNSLQNRRLKWFLSLTSRARWKLLVNYVVVFNNFLFFPMIDQLYKWGLLLYINTYLLLAEEHICK